MRWSQCFSGTFRHLGLIWNNPTRKLLHQESSFSQDLTLVDFPWEITSYLCEFNAHISCTFALSIALFSRTSLSKIMLEDARDWEIKISMECNGSRNFSWTLLLTDGNLILPFDPLILILDWSCSMGANFVVGINRSCWSLKVCFMS